MIPSESKAFPYYAGKSEKARSSILQLYGKAGKGVKENERNSPPFGKGGGRDFWKAFSEALKDAE